jgi:hypoxanthine phosphoribosyltransferase
VVEREKQHNKTLVFTYEDFSKSIDFIVKKVKESGKKYEYIYAIPRGGLIVGLYLSHRLNIPLADFETEEEALEHNLLIVDDIQDTNKTLSKYKHYKWDKAVLISKMKGYKKDSKVITRKIIQDNVWVKFMWEVD